MMATTVKPTNPRFKVIETLDAVEVTFPAKRSWPITMGVTVVVGWYVAAVAVKGMELLREDIEGTTRLFLILFMIVSISVCALVIAGAILYQLFSIVRVRVSPNVVVIRQETLGLGHTKVYELWQVKDVRVVPELREMSRTLPESIAFDYGASTIRFAEGLKESEMKLAAERIDSAVRQMKDGY